MKKRGASEEYGNYGNRLKKIKEDQRKTGWVWLRKPRESGGLNRKWPTKSKADGGLSEMKMKTCLLDLALRRAWVALTKTREVGHGEQRQRGGGPAHHGDAECQRGGWH